VGFGVPSTLLSPCGSVVTHGLTMHLELSRVFKTYGRSRALDSVSMSLEPGQVVAVLGANGAGK